MDKHAGSVPETENQAMTEQAFSAPVAVLPGDRKVLAMLRRRAGGDRALRWSTLCLRQPVEGGLLLYQTLTQVLLFVPRALVPALEEPAEALRTLLRDGCFLVPADLDEHRTVGELRETLRLMSPPGEKIVKYTVLPTTACNARCPYCFEKDWQPVTMSPALADEAADYMLAHGADRFEVDWFGGEPLVNWQAIDRICRRLTRGGARFRSSMFSNAYLFDPEMIARAREDWRLWRVTVTLDGCEALYNRTKAYVGVRGSAFARVLDNIRRLNEAGINTNIRMNLETDTLPEFRRLTELLIREFGGGGFRGVIYPLPIYEYTDDPSSWRTEAARAEILAAMRELSDALNQAGLSPKPRLPGELKIHNCMADSGNMVTILPDGKLGLCEHYVRDHFLGDIHSGTLDPEIRAAFCRLAPEIPACADCPVYPQCVRLEKCTSDFCSPQYRSYKEDSYKSAMRNAWQSYLKEQNKEEAT